MNEREINERANRDLTSDDESVINKKSITAADVGDALGSFSAKSADENEAPVFKSAGIWIISLLMIVSGAAVAVFTSLTGVGIIIGLIIVVAGIAMPFIMSRR
ncbi:MAG TPA: hypothetical protein VF556_14490 [Pyrinomonadaceae bacterium]|jgi:uncharacterized membrane-anchored protein